MTMALSKSILAIILFVVLFDKHADCNDAAPPSNNEDASSIPMIASGKRMHNIMRFGKRPAGGHNLIHFGKRESSRVPQHSFLYFGKRDGEQNSLPGLLNYLQQTADNSNKRGHSIMRFGKRDPGSNDFIGYGDNFDGYAPDDFATDEDKRGGHSMLYFGKRAGHNMMYFGKRTAGHNILSFGKRDDDKRAHSMIHFGKREDYEDDNLYPEEKRGGHAMFHFGKREDDDDESYSDGMKRASHSMIHFGKRNFEDEPIPFYWNPAASEKDSQIRYGKKAGKNNHAMIHFGKRDDDKRSHAMIHFGKRSVDESSDSAINNHSDTSSTKTVTRMRRDVEAVGNSEPLVTLVRYSNDDDEGPEEELENAIKASQANLYSPFAAVDHLPYLDDEQPSLPFYPDFRPVIKKDSSKNMFMRFG